MQTEIVGGIDIGEGGICRCPTPLEMVTVRLEVGIPSFPD